MYVHTPALVSLVAFMGLSAKVTDMPDSILIRSAKTVQSQMIEMNSGKTTQSKSILIEGEFNGKRVQVECDLDAPNCVIPKPGRYRFRKLPEAESIYTDCWNVGLYENPKKNEPEKLIGKYCLL